MNTCLNKLMLYGTDFLPFLLFSPILLFPQTSSLLQLTKAIQALMTDYEDGFEVFGSEAKVNESEKIDALEVNLTRLLYCIPASSCNFLTLLLYWSHWKC